MSDTKFDDVLSEQDFYPPPDNRVLESYIEDIDGGDNFADYCRYMFKIMEMNGDDDGDDNYNDYCEYMSKLNKLGYSEYLVD